MLYKSTRGGASGLSYKQVLLSTYAGDGGLYVPEYLPFISFERLRSWKDFSIDAICAEVMALFTDGISMEDLRSMTKRAFKTFNEGKDPPLPMQIFEDIITLDTSLGPTLAFKDIGQQVVAQLLNYVLGNESKKANIVVETSGDTGPAAIAAVRGCDHVNIFCLYPNGRVSRVQELQMITVIEPNVHVFKTQGDTDEQASVLKELFRDAKFVDEFNIVSINSINWFRIAAQSTYYIWAYLQVFNSTFSIGRLVNFSIPTGAFGNAMGGFLAKRMGVPIGRIGCATNANDIVYRTISTGDMSMGSNVQTESPAMDIQFAYNLERMLFYVCNENPIVISEIMGKIELQYSMVPGAPGVQLDRTILNRIRETFEAVSVSDEDTLKTMAAFKSKYDFSLCPHSAIGVFAAQTAFRHMLSSGPTVCVLTAHPAKFEEAVKRATGAAPVLPEHVQAMASMPHKFRRLRKPQPDSPGDPPVWRLQWIRIIKDAIRQQNVISKKAKKKLSAKELLRKGDDITGSTQEVEVRSGCLEPVLGNSLSISEVSESETAATSLDSAGLQTTAAIADIAADPQAPGSGSMKKRRGKTKGSSAVPEEEVVAVGGPGPRPISFTLAGRTMQEDYTMSAGRTMQEDYTMSAGRTMQKDYTMSAGRTIPIAACDDVIQARSTSAPPTQATDKGGQEESESWVGDVSAPEEKKTSKKKRRKNKKAGAVYDGTTTVTPADENEEDELAPAAEEEEGELALTGDRVDGELALAGDREEGEIV